MYRITSGDASLLTYDGEHDTQLALAEGYERLANTIVNYLI